MFPVICLCTTRNYRHMDKFFSGKGWGKGGGVNHFSKKITPRLPKFLQNNWAQTISKKIIACCLSRIFTFQLTETHLSPTFTASFNNMQTLKFKAQLRNLPLKCSAATTTALYYMLKKDWCPVCHFCLRFQFSWLSQVSLHSRAYFIV